MSSAGTAPQLLRQGSGKYRRIVYFAYGSNMHPEQIGARCLNPALLGAARLPDHRLDFFGHSWAWDGGQETVVPAPSQDVWGVVYELSASDCDSLDAWQGARFDGGGPYFHFPICVVDAQGRAMEVLLYKKDILGRPSPPSRGYLDFIVQAAVLRNLPAAYVKSLRSIASRETACAVPRQGRFNPGLLLAATCADCESGRSHPEETT